MEQKIYIEGMSCHHCEMRVEKALKGLKEVKKAKANHEDGTCVINVKKAVEESVIKELIHEAGYSVTKVE